MINEFETMARNLTPDDRQIIRDYAVANVRLKLPECLTAKDLLELCVHSSIAAFIDRLVEKSPQCACGHRKLLHEESEFRCAVPKCQCMIFFNNTDALAKAIPIE